MELRNHLRYLLNLLMIILLSLVLYVFLDWTIDRWIGVLTLLLVTSTMYRVYVGSK